MSYILSHSGETSICLDGADIGVRPEVTNTENPHQREPSGRYAVVAERPNRTSFVLYVGSNAECHRVRRYILDELRRHPHEITLDSQLFPHYERKREFMIDY